MTIVPVTDDNVHDVLALTVLPDQRRHIETPGECLQEAAQVPAWRPVALYVEKTAVGFAMYGCFRDEENMVPEGDVWLDRLLIDRQYQGRGYGEEALVLLLRRLKAEYGADRIYLSVYADNAVAIALYRKHGFRFTGALDTKGEQVMCRAELP